MRRKQVHRRVTSVTSVKCEAVPVKLRNEKAFGELVVCSDDVGFSFGT